MVVIQFVIRSWAPRDYQCIDLTGQICERNGIRDFESVIELQIRCAFRAGHCDFVLWSEFKHLERTDKIEHVNGLRTSNYDSPHLRPLDPLSRVRTCVRF